MLRDQLKKYRELNKISQAELAGMLRITRQAYNHYETGRREPDLKMLTKIANIYGVTVDCLLDEGKPAVPEDNGSHKNEVLVRSRNGMVVQKSYTDEQIKFIISLIDAIPDNDDDDDI